MSQKRYTKSIDDILDIIRMIRDKHKEIVKLYPRSKVEQAVQQSLSTLYDCITDYLAEEEEISHNEAD